MRALLPSILVASLVGVMLIPNAFAVDVVPDWIKNNAGWWADGEIDDQTFVNGIQFLIKEEIIQVSDTTSGSNNSEFIPEWVKNTAGWWADGEISETEFLTAIQYLIKDGLIKIDEDSSEKINYDYPTYNQLMNDPNLSLNTVFDKKIFDGVMNNPNLSSTEKIILTDKMAPRIAGYRGATFDGESVYFTPYYSNYDRHGIMIKYNTTQPFDDRDSWNVFNIGRYCAFPSDCTYGGLTGFQGALYHNDFVYYVPYFIDMTPKDGKDKQDGSLVLRYDTSLDFHDSSSWEAIGPWGVYEDGIVVGNNLYFSPHLDKNNERHTLPLRYDTTKPFDDRDAWEEIDIGLNASYIGAAYDGKKIYYAPWEDDNQEGSSIMIYDTEQPFSAKSAWDFISIPYRGYSDAGFNGTHVVFAPCWCAGNPTIIESSKIMFLNVDTQEVSFSTLDYGAYNGVVEADDALYLVADTTKNGVRSDFIEVTNSIKTFSPTIAKGGYWGGIFDGQYVYFTPYDNPSLGKKNGEFLRYDTAKPFEDDASWESISFAMTDFKYDFVYPEFDIFSKEWIFAASQNKR